ncbi:MAG: Type secretion system protein [Candidatus Hydrogenedentota bacterium]
MQIATHHKGKRRGAALILALTLLTVFAVLGTSFVVSMSLELDASRLDLRELRAAHLAEAGIHAAIGELSRAVQEGRQADFLAQGTRTYEFPAYKGVMTEQGYALERAPRISFAEVVILDESGKLNLNHAPASMLRLLLNVDGPTARKISSSLPFPALFSPDVNTGRRWLAGPDELLSRGLLTPEQFDALDLSLFTTYSVGTTSKPERFLNVNAAPPEVLAALLDIPVELARQATVRRPFNSLADLESVSGKAADTFNIKPRASAPTSLPPELALDSRCFRLKAKATFGLEEQGTARRSTRHVEAVVVFDGEGGHEITYWSTDNAEDAATVTEGAAAGEAAEGEAVPAQEAAADLEPQAG